MIPTESVYDFFKGKKKKMATIIRIDNPTMQEQFNNSYYQALESG